MLVSESDHGAPRALLGELWDARFRLKCLDGRREGGRDGEGKGREGMGKGGGQGGWWFKILPHPRIAFDCCVGPQEDICEGATS